MFKQMLIVAFLLFTIGVQSQTNELHPSGNLQAGNKKNEIGLDIHQVVITMAGASGQPGSFHSQHGVSYKRQLKQRWITLDAMYLESKESPLILYIPPVFSSNDSTYSLGFSNSRSYHGMITAGLEQRKIKRDNIEFILGAGIVASYQREIGGIYEVDYSNDSLFTFDLDPVYADRVQEEHFSELYGGGISLHGGFRVQVINRCYIHWQARGVMLFSMGKTHFNGSPSIGTTVSYDSLIQPMIINLQYSF